MKHTQLPWWVTPSRDIIKMPEQIKIVNRISGSSHDEAEANAKFIDVACNTHYDLLRASENALKELELIDCIDNDVNVTTSVINDLEMIIGIIKGK